MIESDSRDDTKNFTYAYLYGASDRKLGKMMGGDERLGAELRRRMDTKVPGLGELHDWLRFRLSKGFVVGLDGRHVPIRHAHAALNTLLQSDGGILMKWALRRLVDTSVEDAGIRMGENYCFCVNSHDEWQAECPTRQDADAFGKHAVRSIEQAGLHLDVRCPLTGEYKIGRTWEDTH